MERRPDDEVRRRSDSCGRHKAAAMFRRIDRNIVAKVPTEPAETAAQALSAWIEDRGIAVGQSDVASLLKRLRGCRLLFDDDGALVGSLLVDALRQQAELVRKKDWPNRSRLRLLSDHVSATLGDLGFL